MAAQSSYDDNAPSGAIDTLWYTRCPVPTASSIALNHGWLDAEFIPDGIRLTSLRESSDPRHWESHFDHTVANSFREGGNIPPIWARSQGNDVRLIGLHWADHIQAIIVRSDAGIDSVRDLRGRRFGLPRRQNDQIDFWAALGLRILATALQLEGLELSDVEIVELNVTDKWLTDLDQSTSAGLWESTARYAFQRAETMALACGHVDATFSTSFRAVELVGMLDAKVLVDVGAHSNRAARVTNMNPAALTASGQLCDDHPDLVARYLQRAIQAGEWAKTHRRETVSMVAREVVAADAVVEAGFSPGFHTQLVPQLTDDGLAALTSQKDFLLLHGFIESDVDMTDFVDPRPLSEAKKQNRA